MARDGAEDHGGVMAEGDPRGEAARAIDVEPEVGANARTVLERRYLGRDEAGQVIERPGQLYRRVAHAVAAAEQNFGASPSRVAEVEDAFHGMMSRSEFLPNSPALMNAGHELGQLAACFVVPVEDSMTGIFDAVKWAAMIQMSGGGTGFSFSRLRPAGDRVASTGGTASGPVPFIDIFNIATDTIVQGGRRRGANMGILRVDHPDIVDFIRAKLDARRLNNFNLSVAVTDDFMAAVAADRDYALVNPRTGAEVRRLRARVIWRLISNLAWQSAEPGVVFIDRINAAHPARHIGLIESTNPCVTGDTRVLVEDRGWLPIASLVGTHPRVATERAGRIEFQRAAQVVTSGAKPVFRLRTDGPDLRLTADHRVTTERGDVPASELRSGDRVRLLARSERDAAFATVMELVPEGEEEVFDLTEPTSSHFFANGLLVHNCGEQPLLPFESCVLGSINVAKFVQGGKLDEGALAASVQLAVRFLDDVIEVNRYPLPQIEDITRKNRKIGLGVMGFADLLIELGVPYDEPEAVAVADRLMALIERESVAASRQLARERGAFAHHAGSSWDRPGAEPMRNATTTTVAPTGTISIIAGCSSGIEPLFAVSFVRNVLEGTRLTEVHAGFRRIAEERGFASEALFAAIAASGGVRGLDAVPADVQRLFATAHDVPPEQHVRIQAAFQRHVHSSVSKTINLPERSTADQVAGIYELAYALGCKGVTVYRDGSRDSQVLSFGADAVRAAETPQAEAMPAEMKCPDCGESVNGQRGCVVCIHCGWSRCG